MKPISGNQMNNLLVRGNVNRGKLGKVARAEIKLEEADFEFYCSTMGIINVPQANY
jgi:hypothetical protein